MSTKRIDPSSVECNHRRKIRYPQERCLLHDYGVPVEVFPCSANESLPREYAVRAGIRRDWGLQLALMERAVREVSWADVYQIRGTYCLDDPRQMERVMAEVVISEKRKMQVSARLAAIIAQEPDEELKKRAKNARGSLEVILEAYLKVMLAGFYGTTISLCGIGQAGLLRHVTERTLRTYMCLLERLGLLEKRRMKRPASSADRTRFQDEGKSTPKAMYDTLYIALAPRMIAPPLKEELEIACRLVKQRDCDRYAGKRNLDREENRRAYGVHVVEFPNYPSNAEVLELENVGSRWAEVPKTLDSLKNRNRPFRWQTSILTCAEKSSAQNLQRTNKTEHQPLSCCASNDTRKLHGVDLLCRSIEDATRLLGFSSLREGQATAIGHGRKRDLFLRCGTGFGKSAIFQILGLLTSGKTLVVVPLRALMEDQVSKLRDRGIPSFAIGSSSNVVPIGQSKFIYCSPEHLLNRNRVSELQSMGISRVVIDEAHVALTWNQFRPAYSDLGNLRKLFPGALLMATTATANELERAQILALLGMTDAAVFDSSAGFKNLSLSALCLTSFGEKYAWLKDEMTVPSAHRTLIFCSTRRDVESLGRKMQSWGHEPVRYHGGMTREERDRAVKVFGLNEQGLMLATQAYGLGVDPPLVSRVVQFSPPQTLALLAQQFGRAGRAGEAVQGWVLSAPGDAYRVRFRGLSTSSTARYEAVRSWVQSRACRMVSLTSEFGMQSFDRCGLCDNCVSDQGAALGHPRNRA